MILISAIIIVITISRSMSSASIIHNLNEKNQISSEPRSKTELFHHMEALKNVTYTQLLPRFREQQLLEPKRSERDMERDTYRTRKSARLQKEMKLLKKLKMCYIFLKKHPFPKPGQRRRVKRTRLECSVILDMASDLKHLVISTEAPFNKSKKSDVKNHSTPLRKKNRSFKTVKLSSADLYEKLNTILVNILINPTHPKANLDRQYNPESFAIDNRGTKNSTCQNCSEKNITSSVMTKRLYDDITEILDDFSTYPTYKDVIGTLEVVRPKRNLEISSPKNTTIAGNIDSEHLKRKQIAITKSTTVLPENVSFTDITNDTISKDALGELDFGKDISKFKPLFDNNRGLRPVIKVSGWFGNWKISWDKFLESNPVMQTEHPTIPKTVYIPYSIFSYKVSFYGKRKDYDRLNIECSGMLISPQWILTSMVCDIKEDWTILIGMHRLPRANIPIRNRYRMRKRVYSYVENVQLVMLDRPVAWKFLPPKIRALNDKELSFFLNNKLCSIITWIPIDVVENVIELREYPVLTPAKKCSDANQRQFCVNTETNFGLCKRDLGSPVVCDGLFSGILIQSSPDCLHNQTVRLLCPIMEWVTYFMNRNAVSHTVKHQNDASKADVPLLLYVFVLCFLTIVNK